jgi:hypothetical protein
MGFKGKEKIKKERGKKREREKKGWLVIRKPADPPTMTVWVLSWSLARRSLCRRSGSCSGFRWVQWFYFVVEGR